jgi:type IV secretory pathway VirJ component
MKVWYFALIILVFLSNIVAQTPKQSLLIAELPLKEFYIDGNSDYFVFLFTGDGGWKSLTTGMGEFFQQQKVPLVGLDVKKYFWIKRSQVEITESLEVIIENYCTKWQKKKVVLIGYSFGAEVLPFAAGELSKDLKSKIERVILIAPDQHAEFEVTISSMLDFSDGALPVSPEMVKIPAELYFILCDDSESALCNVLDKKYDYIILHGGHHFDGDFKNLYQLVWNKINVKL